MRIGAAKAGAGRLENRPEDGAIKVLAAACIAVPAATLILTRELLGDRTNCFPPKKHMASALLRRDYAAMQQKVGA